MVDRMDGLGATFDGESKSFVFEFLLQRRNKFGDIGIAFGLFCIECVSDVFIRFVVGKFEGEVLHLGLDLVESETVCEGCMERLRLFCDMSPMFRVAFFIQLTEEV